MYFLVNADVSLSHMMKIEAICLVDWLLAQAFSRSVYEWAKHALLFACLTFEIVHPFFRQKVIHT